MFPLTRIISIFNNKLACTTPQAKHQSAHVIFSGQQMETTFNNDHQKTDTKPNSYKDTRI